MKFKFFVYCPDDKKVIHDIIEAASNLGAGVYGNYSHVAFITRGDGNWKTEKGAQPYEGKVGEVTISPVARIEMTCLAEKSKLIKKAIKSVHPWEQVDIEFVRLEDIDRK